MGKSIDAEYLFKLDKLKIIDVAIMNVIILS